MKREEFEEHRQLIRNEIFQSLDFSRETTDEEMYELIDRRLLDSVKELPMTASERLRMRKELFASIRKLDVLQELVDDPGVTEIMVNGTDNIFVEQRGRIRRYEAGFESKEKLEDVIQQIVAGCNRVVNEASPIVDARLENGSRVNIVLYPVALNGPVITIPRFPEHPMTIERLI